jgi:phosphoglycerol transferase MdoB-like AlkP superfamily enzyme
VTELFNKSPKTLPIIRKSMESFRNYNQNAIKQIETLCNEKPKHPLFSFTHFMLPHDPYQVDENGNFISGSIPNNTDMQGYLRQLKYCNKLITSITECLLKDSTRKKIIIIQGDHGYRHYTDAPIEKKYEALNAIFFYNQDYNGLTNTFSHVNTFRIVINKFFNGHMPMLKDSIKNKTN